MECATKPPSKSSSNISDIVSKFARVCRFRSIGVFSTENPSHHHHPSNGIFDNAPLTEDSSNASGEGECDVEKVHPHPVEIPPKTTQCTNVEILKLFDTISALKLAYVRLQEAHIPYDPAKIKAANELVVAELEVLMKVKHTFKEKQFKEVDSISGCSALMVTEIHVHEKFLEKLKCQIKVKNTEILELQQELQDLDLKNREFVEVFKQKERESIKILSLPSFEDVFKAASKAIHDFAKPLISLMKASGFDLERAADSIEASVVYSRRSHKKYAFESYIARMMFYKMPSRSYNVDSVLRTKYLSVVHPMMEVSFFGNLDHRTFVSSGRHPRTPFYQAFVKMARWVWVLQGIVASSEPRAEMYRVERGSEFSDVCMESVLNENIIISDEGRSRFKVEFMVMPGFKIGETLVRSPFSSSRRFSGFRSRWKTRGVAVPDGEINWWKYLRLILREPWRPFVKEFAALDELHHEVYLGLGGQDLEELHDVRTLAKAPHPRSLPSSYLPNKAFVVHFVADVAATVAGRDAVVACSISCIDRVAISQRPNGINFAIRIFKEEETFPGKDSFQLWGSFLAWGVDSTIDVVAFFAWLVFWLLWDSSSLEWRDRWISGTCGAAGGGG
ncbi:serine/threonine protein kinase 1 [Actinidia rufa]|uniref:Serine/threonine protein kinase 1 n=1 Tax=Actinidia rufa TaxID=165716 RepID=A0A7J0HA65_9ERIC|nr:serine/threonine protein kinase 1 [Actinidia rufa]